jgi:hypothetical protein
MHSKTLNDIFLQENINRDEHKNKPTNEHGVVKTDYIKFW